MRLSTTAGSADGQVERGGPMSGTYLSNPYQRPADPRTFRGGCRRESGVGWRGGAFSGRALDPCQLRLQERCVSQSMYRRRRGWRTVASTLALTLGSLAIPAAALADGLIDPNFNGTGYAVGPAFSGQDNRVPMVIEPDGKIVVGGCRRRRDDAHPLQPRRLGGLHVRQWRCRAASDHRDAERLAGHSAARRR